MVSTKVLAEIDTSNFEVVHREMFALDKTQPVLTFDFSGKGSVTFNKSSLDAIGDPEYVLHLINPEKKIFALKKWHKIGRRERAPKGVKVERNEEGACVHEGCLPFLTKVAEVMEWKTESYNRFRFFGTGTEDNDMVIFHLTEAVMFAGKAEETDGTVETAAS